MVIAGPRTRQAEQLARRARRALPLAAQSGGDLTDYAGRPVEFAQEILQVALTEQQKAIALSVATNRETNVQAAHSVGKTFLGAILALYWIFAEHGLFISTAPTKRQVNELLWGEIRKLYDRHRDRLGGHRGQTFVRLTEEARGYGFTSRSSGDVGSSGFQGIHAGKLLILLDEANGVSDEIDAAASACVTGSSNRILRIGNPTATGTAFENSCDASHIRIPVWDHPNVNWAYKLHGDGVHRLKPAIAAQIVRDGEVVPQEEWPPELPRDKISGAVSIEWIESVRTKRGEGTAYWLSRVEGIFPEAAGNSIIPQSWFRMARARYDTNPEYWDKVAARYPWRHGLDVADGNDEHAIARWRGPVLYAVREQPSIGDRLDVTRAANMGWNDLCEFPGVLSVDRTGVGAGALSDLLGRMRERSDELLGRCTVQGCTFGAKPEESDDDPFITDNLKSSLYWSLREAFRQGEVAIAPLGSAIEDKVMKGFSLIYYEELPSGKTVVEPKKKTKKRLKRSPDPEDAIVIGWGAKPERLNSPL